MARPVIKPLKMADGTYVRTSIDELREHFDLPSVLGYFADGRLKEWLEYRHCEKEAELLAQLDPKASDFNMRLCEVLGVVCLDDTDVSIDAIAARNAKLAQLKQFTDSDEIIQNVDKVAFTQDEMTDMLDRDADLIYLFGEHFTVTPDKENVTFIGLNSPVVHIAEENAKDFYAKKISFQSVIFSDKHIKALLKSYNHSKENAKLQFSLNILCERDGWIYFAPYNGLCRISSDGKVTECLSSFDRSIHQYSCIQIAGGCIYCSIYSNGTRKYSLIDGTTSIDNNIFTSGGFVTHTDKIITKHGNGELNLLEFDGNKNYPEDKQCIAKVGSRSQYFVYDKSIYYYRDNKIYVQKLDGGQEIALCSTGKKFYYLDDDWLYFWDRNYCLNKIRSDGSDSSKTNISCLDLFGDDESRYNSQIGHTRIHEGYFYYFPRREFQIGYMMPSMVKYPSGYLSKVKIGKPGHKCSNAISIAEDISDKYRIISNHIYDILNDGNRFGLVKYTLDGKQLWKRYIEKD